MGERQLLPYISVVESCKLMGKSACIPEDNLPIMWVGISTDFSVLSVVMMLGNI